MYTQGPDFFLFQNDKFFRRLICAHASLPESHQRADAI